jgi:ribonuclease HII
MDKPFVIGSDEVGYGCFAGSVCVGAVKATINWNMLGLNDSKKLSPKKREVMRQKLLTDPDITYHIAERSSTYIDQVGIAVALKEAYIECFRTLFTADCLVIVDGTLKFEPQVQQLYCPQSIIKADTKIPTVMAASILAKTHRDEQMRELHKLYDGYDWQNNMGYGTAKHLEGIKKHGLTPLHRLSYEPMKSMVGK